jgi:hypothetical protein
LIELLFAGKNIEDQEGIPVKNMPAIAIFGALVVLILAVHPHVILPSSEGIGNNMRLKIHFLW